MEENLKIQKNKEEIISLLRSTNRPGIENLISYLKNTDYFFAPAAATNHGNFEGELATHSLNVYRLLKEKNERYNLGLAEDSIIISALLHDLCKVGVYKKSYKLRKNCKNQWEAYQTWEFEENMPIGHGEKSVIIAQCYIKLKREEVLMIRWHMGPFVPQGEERDLYKAMDVCAGIVAIHTADFESSRFLEETRTEETIISMDEYNRWKASQE